MMPPEVSYIVTANGIHILETLDKEVFDQVMKSTEMGCKLVVTRGFCRSPEGFPLITQRF